MKQFLYLNAENAFIYTFLPYNYIKIELTVTWNGFQYKISFVYKFAWFFTFCRKKWNQLN
jgi:hypothetical protein